MPGILKPLFRWNFWFEAIPSPFSGWSGELVFWSMLIFLAVGLLAFFVASFAHRVSFLKSRLEKFYRLMLRRISGLLITAGFFGLVWYWLTQARIPLFGMRAFVIVWVVIFGGWTWYLVRSIRAQLLQRKTEEERKPYEKWLPKPKK